MTDIQRSTYRPNVGRYIDISTDARPTPLDRYVGRNVDRHIGRDVDRHIGPGVRKLHMIQK